MITRDVEEYLESRAFVDLWDQGGSARHESMRMDPSTSQQARKQLAAFATMVSNVREWLGPRRIVLEQSLAQLVLRNDLTVERANVLRDLMRDAAAVSGELPTIIVNVPQQPAPTVNVAPPQVHVTNNNTVEGPSGELQVTYSPKTGAIERISRVKS